MYLDLSVTKGENKCTIYHENLSSVQEPWRMSNHMFVSSANKQNAIKNVSLIFWKMTFCYIDMNKKGLGYIDEILLHNYKDEIKFMIPIFVLYSWYCKRISDMNRFGLKIVFRLYFWRFLIDFIIIYNKRNPWNARNKCGI